MIEVKEMVELLDMKKASNIKVLDFQTVSSLFDYFIICTAQNIRQIQALVDAVDLEMKHRKEEVKSIEGKVDSGWIVIDLFHIVVHIFIEEQREHYQLEKLWLGLEV